MNIHNVYKNNLNISCWNINGYKHKGYNKYSDPRFIGEIVSKDIICLLETHCPYDQSLVLPGFKSVHLIRPKPARINKQSGGISVFVRNEIRPGIKFLEHCNNDYIWLKLCKDFFGTLHDIYLCFLYNSPVNSTYTNSLDIDLLDLIEKDIIRYSEIGKILIAGDINARTGTCNFDFIDQDSTDSFIPLYEDYTPDNLIDIRYSKDSVLNSRGKELNDLCVQTGLRILNGRVRGDYIGELTCHNFNGSSVVDYFLASESILQKIDFFNVHKFLADLSDHSQISVMLKIKCKLENREEASNPTPVHYIWDKDSETKFQTALSSKDIQNKINTFMENKYNNVENMITDFNAFLTEAADISLKRKKIKNGTNKRLRNKNKKWFDVSLIKLRRQLDNKEQLLRKYNKDPIVRGSFFSLLKLYRKNQKI